MRLKMTGATGFYDGCVADNGRVAQLLLAATIVAMATPTTIAIAIAVAQRGCVLLGEELLLPSSSAHSLVSSPLKETTLRTKTWLYFNIPRKFLSKKMTK